MLLELLFTAAGKILEWVGLFIERIEERVK